MTMSKQQQIIYVGEPSFVQMYDVCACVERYFKLFVCAVLLYSFYGDRGYTAGEHVNRHDGQHLSEDRRDPERVAETSEWINDDKQSYCTILPPLHHSGYK